MRRATPPEQVQTVPLTRHDEGQVGRTVECGHRKGTERGLLPAPPLILKQHQCLTYLQMIIQGHRQNQSKSPFFEIFAELHVLQ